MGFEREKNNAKGITKQSEHLRSWCDKTLLMIVGTVGHDEQLPQNRELSDANDSSVERRHPT